MSYFDSGRDDDDTMGDDTTSDDSSTAAPASSGGFFSSIANFFSPSTPASSVPATSADGSTDSTDDSSTPATPAPTPVINSEHFTYAQLTVTQQNADNTPTAFYLVNLQQLATLLDLIYDTIGPFTVLSAFRSAAVEAALTAAGEPTAEAAAGHISFHEVGLAADIVPTSTDLQTFFGQILAAMGTSSNPGPLWNQMAEIAYKPTQGSIHLAGAVTYRANNVVLSLNSSGTYASLTADEIAGYAGPFAAEAFSDVADVVSDVTGDPMSMGIMVAIGIGIAFAIYHWRKPIEKEGEKAYAYGKKEFKTVESKI